jgi:hypothetical protein
MHAHAVNLHFDHLRHGNSRRLRADLGMILNLILLRLDEIKNSHIDINIECQYCSIIKGECRECLRDRTKEIDEMKGVFRVDALHELPLVITIGKQADVSGKGIEPARKAPGLASQPFQVMTQICIDSFH